MEKVDVNKLINVLLDVLVNHGNLEIYCELPIQFIVKGEEEEKYLQIAFKKYE